MIQTIQPQIVDEVGDFTDAPRDHVGEHDAPPLQPDPLEEPLVVEEVEMPISGQAILWMGVGLLAMGGVVGVEEARELACLAPLSAAEHEEMLKVAKWAKTTGCVAIPPALFRFFFEALG